jgi:membrane-bound lytic murein transglycosylase F
MHKKKQFLIRFLLLAFLLPILSNCSEENGQLATQKLFGTPNDVKEIIKRGKLTILAENSSTSFFIYRGKKMGFEYELLQAFANDLGVPLEVKIINNLDNLIHLLNTGEGDIIACNYTVNKKRAKKIAFSTPYLRSAQVLVQRKPKGWRKLKSSQLETLLLRDPIELAGKKVNVWQNSSYYQRLLHLEEEIGDEISIIEEKGAISSEDLIEKVANGEIDYTVTEEIIGRVNAHFYPNIDYKTVLSIRQKIGFGLRKTSPELLKKLDKWLLKFMTTKSFRFLCDKYFNPENFIVDSYEYVTKVLKGEISPFDKLFKASAAKHGVDWRLVASIAFQETKFHPNARGFGGAYSIMQFMPGTGPQYGVFPSSTVEKQIDGGTKKISQDFKSWREIPDTNQRIKFTVATYNCGRSHVEDAQRLAKKVGLNPLVWDENVEYMLFNLSRGKYYRDGVVKSGAVRGSRTTRYVRSIFARFENWKKVIP